ncbi:MAG: diguanylate cyclase [Thiotrichales bacterium]|nr:diguanylate cyclase [Thiotrichales bacterium]
MKDWVRKLLGKDLFNAVSSLENPRHAFRTLLLTMVIAVLDLVMLGFALLHYFYTQDMPLAIASIVAALVLSVAFLYLRTTQNISITGHFSSVAIVIFFPIYAHLNQNDQFGLIWLFVVPFLAVAFNGYRIGLAYILVYSVVIMSEAHLNIGVWEAGNWTHLSTLRLLVGLLVFTALATVLDVANEHLNRRIENQRRKEDVYLSKLKKLSTIDGLTSLYNRRHFNDVLNQKVKELKDSDLYLTFFILDIDHFKHYNDHYGHQKGDQALQRVAAVVRQFMKRHHDLVFRMGGGRVCWYSGF